jgi:Rps23 Pro-64 3,4-dihydroxylase Tpa1-like proline 4-hydroxylase
MKIFQNVLGDQLYNDCILDLNEKIDNTVWQSSILSWSDSVLVGIRGSCLFSFLPETLSLRIYEEISSKIENKFEKYVMYYCIWQPYSGLSLHDDDHHKLGATIYLNDSWSVNDGGIFLWKEKSNPYEMYRGISPTKNLMILNDNKEEHLVTPISPHSTKLRTTIQIWFDNS